MDTFLAEGGRGGGREGRRVSDVETMRERFISKESIARQREGRR